MGAFGLKEMATDVAEQDGRPEVFEVCPLSEKPAPSDPRSRPRRPCTRQARRKLGAAGAKRTPVAYSSAFCIACSSILIAIGRWELALGFCGNHQKPKMLYPAVSAVAGMT